jgi:hypothetical protein
MSPGEKKSKTKSQEERSPGLNLHNTSMARKSPGFRIFPTIKSLVNWENA